MLLSSFATALLAFSTFTKASNSSSETLADLQPADLPDPRTLIYKEVCFRNVLDDADNLPTTAQAATKDSNNHRIFYRTGTKEDFDPIADPVAEEEEGAREGMVVGFEEFCYRMRRAKGDVDGQNGQGGTLKTKSK
ncbi:hypothetical protein JCM10296v2_001324 [Rhodotorula toruloides]